jgi:membrane-associated protein
MIDRFVNYVLNMDVYLAELVDKLGPWVYAAIAAVIFAETGLVVMPWLPGESLLLTSGTLAGSGILNILILAPVLFAAAFLGDVCNYLIGRYVGRHLLAKPRRYLKPEHVAQATEFYERHGGMAIVFARFLPVVRTLAPFTAGVAGMEIHRLMFFAAIASGLWVTIFLGAGYWFGSYAWVQDYLAVALAVIVAASATPALVIYVVHRVRRRRAASAGVDEAGGEG